MVPSMAAVLRAPRKLCSFSYVLLVFLLVYVLDVVSITVYDRHTLLVPPSRNANRTLSLVQRHDIRALCLDHTTEETPSEKREESWRPRQTETPCLPTSSPSFCWLTFSHWTTNSVYTSGGPLSPLTCCVNVRLLSGDKKNIAVNLFSKLGWELGLYYGKDSTFICVHSE